MNLIPISLVAKRTQGEWHRQSQGRQKSECLELLASQPGSLFNIYIRNPRVTVTATPLYMVVKIYPNNYYCTNNRR